MTYRLVISNVVPKIWARTNSAIVTWVLSWDAAGRVVEGLKSGEVWVRCAGPDSYLIGLRQARRFLVGITGPAAVRVVNGDRSETYGGLLVQSKSNDQN